MAAETKRDPDLEWLDHVQPVGLVVAPVLLRELGLAPSRQTQADSAVVTSLVGDDRSKPSLQEPWAFFEQVLGWEASHVAGSPGGPALPDDLSVRLPEHDTTLAPTWAVRELDKADQPWQLLIRLEPAGLDPDKRHTTDGWEATPQQRFERLLRETGVFAGLLVSERNEPRDGEDNYVPELRLVYAPRGESSGYLKFPLRALATVAGRPMLGGLKLLLDSFRLFADASDRRLLALLKKSREAQAAVSTALAEQVLGALHELLRGLDAAEPNLIREFAKSRDGHLYEGLLTVLMRLVFTLYAEDRDLLPSRTDGRARQIYETSYSLRGLYARLAEDSALNPDTMDERRGGWGQMLALFRLIHKGHPSHFVQARGGKLFDPDQFPFLEGRNKVEDAPRVLPVSDGCILRVLEGLMTLQARGGTRERLSYRTLDVEQIGSVYETVMGFNAEVAKGPSLAIKAGKNNRTPVFVDLGRLAAAKGKERIKYLKDEADRGQLSATVSKAIEAAKTADDLAVALDPIVDERASPKKHVVSAGTPLLQPTDERRRTGSHYTPRNLTEPIVSHALEPAFERLGPDATPEQILDLKVCDPAMGSGAFLVEACRALATRLVDAWSRHPDNKPVIPPDEDEELHARRLVARRCLYGVDKNPLATDLAKLSLWLATLARDHEFTFLDHALKSGDSLVGLTQTQIAAANWDTSKPGLPLFRQLAKDRVAEVMKGRAEIQGAPDDTARAIQEARHRSLEERIKEIRLIGDAVIAAFFAEDKPRARERKRAEVESWLGGSPVKWDKLAETAATLQKDEKPLMPFHWEIEFPEVFARESHGFDAVIGNPPFVDSELMTKEIPQIREYVAHSYSCAKGNWDLYVPFIEKAVSICGAHGTTALISPNKWFGAPYASTLREKTKDRLSAVLDFSTGRFFPEVGVAAICCVLTETQAPAIEVLRFSAIGEPPRSVEVGREIIRDHGTWGMLLSSHLDIVSKLLSTGEVLRKHVEARDPFTVSEAYELKEYVVEENCASKDSVFKLINTGTIDPYVTLWGMSELRYLKGKFARPVIRREDLKLNFPKRYSQACSSKIVISGMRKFEAFLDTDGEYVAGKSTVVVTAKDGSLSLITLLGILNSRLARFFIQEVFGVLGIDGGISFSGDIVKQLPLPAGFRGRLTSVEVAVTQILQRIAAGEMPSDFDIVDEAVFDAYGIGETDRKKVMECVLQC